MSSSPHIPFVLLIAMIMPFPINISNFIVFLETAAMTDSEQLRMRWLAANGDAKGLKEFLEMRLSFLIFRET